MKKITILGSTGSIGRQTLDIVRKQPDLKAEVLAAKGSDPALLERQVREFLPSLVCVYDDKKAADLRDRIRDLDIPVASGMDGLIEAAVYEPSSIVVTAFVGMIGIRPTIEAIRAGKDIALANKETLVTAGHIIMPLAREKKVKILPVDSEHSAIFQSLQGAAGNVPDKIILTASGGPFRNMTRKQLENVTVEDALRHPNWKMGQKITIDSATMVNKGLEVIEAKWLFDAAFDDIKVVVQPQSLIHSMVQFKDGAVIAQLGTPDMRLPILYALYYPERRFLDGDRVDFSKIGSIDFSDPDFDTFPGLSYAYEAGRAGGSMPTVLNAANERAVALFLDGKIAFTQIDKIIRAAMDRHTPVRDPDVNQILEIERDTHKFIESRW